MSFIRTTAIAGLLLLSALTFPGCSVELGSRSPVPAPQVLVTELSEDGLLRIEAENVPVRDVLAELHERHDLVVQVGGLEAYEVTATIGPAPVRQVLDELLEGRRYTIGVGRHETNLGPSHTAERPVKPRRVTIPETHRPTVMHGTEHWEARIELRDDGVTVEALNRLPGGLAHRPHLDGRLLYVVRGAGDKPLWFGTRPEPSAAHLDDFAGAGAGLVGHVTVAFPSAAANGRILSIEQLRIQLYRLPADLAIPDYLDHDVDLDRLLAGVEAFASIDGSTLTSLR